MTSIQYMKSDEKHWNSNNAQRRSPIQHSRIMVRRITSQQTNKEKSVRLLLMLPAITKLIMAKLAVATEVAPAFVHHKLVGGHTLVRRVKSHPHHQCRHVSSPRAEYLNCNPLESRSYRGSLSLRTLFKSFNQDDRIDQGGNLQDDQNDQLNVTPSSLLAPPTDSIASELIMPTPPIDMVDKFQSYSFNIRRTRTLSNSSSTDSTSSLKLKSMRNSSSSVTSASCTTAIKSLIHTLNSEALAFKSQRKQHQRSHRQPEQSQLTSTVAAELKTNLNRAVIQAIRGASESHDGYRTIQTIADSAIFYAKEFALYYRNHDDGYGTNESMIQSSPPLPLLESRIFGEAIAGMTRTKASVSKIKTLWSLFISLATFTCDDEIDDSDAPSTNDVGLSFAVGSKNIANGDNFIHDETITNVSIEGVNKVGTANRKVNILATPPSAIELNAMMVALGSRGKVRAALDLYDLHCKGENDGDNTSGSIDSDDNMKQNYLPKIECDAYTVSTMLNVLAGDSCFEIFSSDSHNANAGASSAVRKPKDGISRDDDSYSSKAKVNMKTSISPCWQWRETERILDEFGTLYQKEMHACNNVYEKNFHGTNKLNNYAFAAALKVNEKAMEVFSRPGMRHNGAKAAMDVLQRMQKLKISPDVVTCSAVMSAFDKGRQWRAALSLLDAMQNSSMGNTVSSDDITKTTQSQIGSSFWSLPSPNVYTFATVISACARCGQYDESMKLLDRLRDGSSVGIHRGGKLQEDEAEKVYPNTWVYNAALAACVQSSTHNRKKRVEINNNGRLKMALNILQFMEEDALISGLDTAPNTVSYNTVLAAVGGCDISINYHNVTGEIIGDFFDQSDKEMPFDSDNSESMINEVGLIFELLDKMVLKNLHRDLVTYRNAIIACRSNSEGAVQVLNRALDDNEFLSYLETSRETISEGKRYIINTALSVCASNGDMHLIATIFELMKVHGVQSNIHTMKQLIKSLGASGGCENFMAVLNAMKGDAVANKKILEAYKIDILGSGISEVVPMIEEDHYSSAITGCLKQGELFLALKILNAMKIHNLTPNESSLQGIIFAYCKLATDASAEEFREARKRNAQKKKRSNLVRVQHTTSRTRANAALAMMGSLKSPSMKLQSAVASACGASGMWIEAREILWKVHIAAFREKQIETSLESVQIEQESSLVEISKLHRSLMKLCARSGNVTAALWFTDAIQDLSSKLARNRNFSAPSHILMNGSQVEEVPSAEKSVMNDEKKYLNFKSLVGNNEIGMKGEDWKLVTIAASKSAHWRVCIGTLQFLQPFVEETHPRLALTTSESGVQGVLSTSTPSLKYLDRQYEKLAGALTAAVISFEIRSQYAWALRAIDDWMEWSGRRPRKEAIFSACRVLASRGLGHQVSSLIAKVLRIAPSESKYLNDTDTILDYKTSYEIAIYMEAINALYNNGLYDCADELYAAAVAAGYLPLAIKGEDNDVPKMDEIGATLQTQLKLDLHGMNRAIAHSAVRVSLQHLIQTKELEKVERDVIIVTGRGKRSERYLRPILRPQVQRMLIEEFYPPLGTSTLPGNMGALSVPAADINSWIEHQQQQKSIRLCIVADILKNISTGTSLRRLLVQKIQQEDESLASDKEI